MFQLFRKPERKKEQKVKEAVDKLNRPFDDCKFSTSLDENMAIVKKLFTDAGYVRYKLIPGEENSHGRYFLVFCDGVVNSQIINDNIVRPLMTIVPGEGVTLIDALLAGVVQVGEGKKIDGFRELIESVTYGDTVLLCDNCAQAATLNTKQFNLRSIGEPDNEKVLVGPREGFTESLMSNLSQVLRRLRTHDLKAKHLTLGRRTQTDVCVCYLDSLADKNILEELLRRLNQIDIDGVLDSNYLTELIRDHNDSPFRTTGYTERPDAVVAKLLEGRIAVFVDGTPMVLTVPYLFIENFQSGEDYYFNYYYTSFARILRIIAFFMTVSVPALFISIVAFHQEMLPLPLLIRIAMERQRVPLPAAIEAVIMLLVFDVLRETGIRMPSNIGQALSIVGALVIGQASVDASLVAAPMIIVVAATGITSLLVPRLNAPIIYSRMLLLLLASTFGFFGVVVGLSILLIHINNLTSFGVEQIAMRGSFSFQDSKDILIRSPWWTMRKRPWNLTENKTRQSGGNADG